MRLRFIKSGRIFSGKRGGCRIVTLIADSTVFFTYVKQVPGYHRRIRGGNTSLSAFGKWTAGRVE